MYDLVWDPHLRRVIHSVVREATVHMLRDTLFDAGITTLKRAKAELHADSPYLQALPTTERDLFLETLERTNVDGERKAHWCKL